LFFVPPATRFFLSVVMRGLDLVDKCCPR